MLLATFRIWAVKTTFQMIKKNAAADKKIYISELLAGVMQNKTFFLLILKMKAVFRYGLENILHFV